MEWGMFREGVQVVSNVGILFMMPFILYVLTELKADVREIKSVNLVTIYNRLGEGDVERSTIRNKLDNLEQRVSRMDDEGTKALRTAR